MVYTLVVSIYYYFLSLNIFLFSADVGIEVTQPECYYYLNQTGVYTVDGTNDTDDYYDLVVTILLKTDKQIYKQIDFLLVASMDDKNGTRGAA